MVPSSLAWSVLLLSLRSPPCLYEILGPGAIISKDTGFYITAGEALAKFRRPSPQGSPVSPSLTQGIARRC